jgi:hypothetical protein
MAGSRRRVVVVARRGATGPVVVAVSLATAAACGSEVVQDGPTSTTTASAGGGGTTSLAGGNGPGGNGGFLTVGGGPPGSGGNVEPCAPPQTPETFIVEIPPEGVPATVGDICVQMGMMPVEANTAARITLLKDPMALNLATGQVTVASALLPNVVGLPTIEVVTSPIPELMQMTVSNVAANATGFSFDASWPPPLQIMPSQDSMVIVRATFDMSCPPNQTRQVQAHTHVNLCEGGADYVWVSSGDECTICGVIAEMAPSPIVPDKGADDIGLGRVIRLRLVVLARIGDSLLVWAEHDAGTDVEYEWNVDAGEIRTVAPDVALWTPPANGAHVLQVAVFADDGAAVASFNDVPITEAGLVA